MPTNALTTSNTRHEAGTSSPAQSPMSPIYKESERTLVVTGREIVASDVVALTLTDPTGVALPHWTPGAHIDLVLSAALTRQYSLSGIPQNSNCWRIGVLRTPNSRGGSDAVHEALQLGSEVRVRGPRNHFTLTDATRYIFIAGGIGITPLLPMIATVQQRGLSWTLLYGGRERSTMAFLDELAQYGDRVQVWPQDEFGLPDLPALLGDPHEGTVVYCCGPEGLFAAVERSCLTWPVGTLHTERFAPKPVDSAASTDQPFDLVLQRSGINTVVPPDKTILEAVEEAGLSVLSSCRVGTCGTCEQMVISGDLDHRDSVLTDEDRQAGEYMMICVSRCSSDQLVLDL